MQKAQTPVVSDKQQARLDSATSTAARIRFLVGEEQFSKADAARILGIRYQWVKNVMDKEVKGE
jgi:hypothetical protein